MGVAIFRLDGSFVDMGETRKIDLIRGPVAIRGANRPRRLPAMLAIPERVRIFCKALNRQDSQNAWIDRPVAAGVRRYLRIFVAEIS